MKERVVALIKKEWEEALKNKMVIIGVVVLPLFFLGFSVFMLIQTEKAPLEAKFILLNQTMFYFMLMPMIIPLAIAVYAIVGEKDQKSMEPLLATPLTDIELFLGKVLASIVPSLIVTWLAFGVFLAISAYLVPPEVVASVLSSTWLVAIFLLAPLISIFSVTVSMAISSRVSDTRAAYQLSSFAVLPLIIPIIIFSLRETLISLKLIFLEALIIAIIDVGMLYLSTKIFQREQILTRWK